MSMFTVSFVCSGTARAAARASRRVAACVAEPRHGVTRDRMTA